jgi:hypothetical protein
VKEQRRKKLNKRLKEIDKKPDQADLMDAYTEAPPIKDIREEVHVCNHVKIPRGRQWFHEKLVT